MARMIAQVEALKAAEAALDADHKAWVEARDFAQAQLERIGKERARLLSAQVACLKAEVAE